MFGQADRFDHVPSKLGFRPIRLPIQSSKSSLPRTRAIAHAVVLLLQTIVYDGSERWALSRHSLGGESGKRIAEAGGFNVPRHRCESPVTLSMNLS